MGRYFRRNYDDEPSVGQAAGARLFVIVFIVAGIWLLRSLWTGADTVTDGSSRGLGSAGGAVVGDTLANTAGTDSGHAALRAMLDTYKSLAAFREQARIQVEIAEPGSAPLRETIDVRLAYEAPNRLRFVVVRPTSRTTVTSDGHELRARIVDRAFADFDGQFMKRPAPRQVDVTTVFSATEFADPGRPNELLSVLLGLPVDLTVSSLGMLTDRGALAEMFQQASDISRLSDEKVRGVDCCVVRVTGPSGTYTFWIDRHTNLVQRIDHPVTRLVGPASPQGPVPEARLVSEHIAEQAPLFVAGDFDLPMPADAKLVRHFVSPPRDQDVGILNARVPPFSFTELQGNEFASDRWAGKHAMLIWFNNHPACRQLLTSLRPVFERYRTEDRIFLCAVSTDPPTTMGHQDVRNLAASWGVSIPVVRDLEAVGRDIFNVRQAPTLVVTSPDESGGARIQLVEVGSFPDLAEQLPVVLDQLLSGQNIVEDYVRFVERRQREYRLYLAAASVDAPTTDFEMPPTEIAPATELTRLVLSPLWEIDAVNDPGNITINNSNGRPEVLVHDGWHELIRIDAAGHVITRHRLNTNTDVSRLRTLTTQRGETLFVGCAAQGRSAAVFDSDWRQLVRYPSEERRGGVQDALLTDLDADGKLELYVGFAAGDSVHRVDLNGRCVWANQQLGSVLSLTAVDADGGRHLLVTTTDGNLVPMDANGNLGRSFSIGPRAIHELVAGPNRAGQPPRYCGLTYNLRGDLVVTGLDDQLRETWNYPLPAGSVKRQVQVARTGQVVPGMDWQWLIAGPDGSVHVVSPDGQFVDRFNTGASVHGLAGFRLGAMHVLVVASDNAVRAFRVTRR